MRASLTDDNIYFAMGNCSICVAPSDEGLQMCLHYRRFFDYMNCISSLQTVHTYCLSNNSVYKPRCYELGTSFPKQLDSVIQSQHHCFWQLPFPLQQTFMPPSSSSHILLVDLILQTELSVYFPCISRLFADYFCKATELCQVGVGFFLHCFFFLKITE